MQPCAAPIPEYVDEVSNVLVSVQDAAGLKYWKMCCGIIAT
jgi:hypothetical protein